MDELEAKKTCHSCGADVTHVSRYKNQRGEYLCSKCIDAKKQTARRHSHHQRLGEKSRRVMLYAILVAAASWIFFKLLGILNQLHEQE